MQCYVMLFGILSMGYFYLVSIREMLTNDQLKHKYV